MEVKPTVRYGRNGIHENGANCNQKKKGGLEKIKEKGGNISRSKMAGLLGNDGGLTT